MSVNAKTVAMNSKQFMRWQKMMRLGKAVCQCHQLPERSFFIHNMQFPVCARCTGILIGLLIIGPLSTIFWLGNIYLSLFFILLMMVDGLLQIKGILMSNNVRRLLTGLGFGYGVCILILQLIIFLLSF